MAFKTLLSKELKEIFSGAFIYVLTGLFMLVAGALFYNYLFLNKVALVGDVQGSVLTPLYGNLNFIFVFLAPILTMRSMAYERQNGTMELLLLSSLKTWQIVLAKQLSRMIAVAFLLFPSIIFPLVLSFSGHDDWGVVFSSMLGVFFAASCYLSVGIFAATIISSQVLAAFGSFMILILFMLLVAGANSIDNFLLSQLVKYFSIPFHFEGYLRGVISTHGIVYFVSFISIFVYLASRVLGGNESGLKAAEE